MQLKTKFEAQNRWVIEFLEIYFCYYLQTKTQKTKISETIKLTDEKWNLTAVT